MSKHYLRCSLLGLCVAAGAVVALPVFAAPAARPFAADEKKEDKGEKIAVDKLPKPVVDAVKKDMPGARITKANKLNKDGKVTYYLDDVKVGKKGWDVTLTEDGTIIKKEECHDE